MRFELLVLSGKGGTGKTTITGSLAMTGPEKVIADCDVDAADMHILLSPESTRKNDFYSGHIATITSENCTMCGMCIEKCRFDAITDDFAIKPEMCEGCGMCAYVCPVLAVEMQERLCGEWYVSQTRAGTMVHAALGAGQENSGKLVTTVRQTSGTIAEEKSLPVVLTDGPPGIGCPVIASLTNTSMALLVTEPTVSALHDVQRAYELATHFRVPCAVVLNKADINPRFREEVAGWCASVDVPLVAEINWDTDIVQAQLQGLTVVEYRPDKWRPVFDSIWERLLPKATSDSHK